MRSPAERLLAWARARIARALGLVDAKLHAEMRADAALYFAQSEALRRKLAAVQRHALELFEAADID